MRLRNRCLTSREWKLAYAEQMPTSHEQNRAYRGTQVYVHRVNRCLSGKQACVARLMSCVKGTVTSVQQASEVSLPGGHSYHCSSAESTTARTRAGQLTTAADHVPFAGPALPRLVSARRCASRCGNGRHVSAEWPRRERPHPRHHPAHGQDLRRGHIRDRARGGGE